MLKPVALQESAMNSWQKVVRMQQERASLGFFFFFFPPVVKVQIP